MSHITQFIEKSAYEPFNELETINEYDPPKVSLFKVSAHYLDLRASEEQKGSYTEERKRSAFPEHKRKEYHSALLKGERDSIPYFKALDGKDVKGKSPFHLRFDIEYGRSDLDEKYSNIPYKEIFADAIRIQESIAHHYGMKANMDFDAGAMPVYGIIVNTAKIQSDNEIDSHAMLGQMKAIGINAYVAGISADQIFVPNYKIALVDDNPELPYADSDNESRPLLLAYLKHFNLVGAADAADIEKTFSLLDRNQANKIDMGTLFSKLNSSNPENRLPDLAL